MFGEEGKSLRHGFGHKKILLPTVTGNDHSQPSFTHDNIFCSDKKALLKYLLMACEGFSQKSASKSPRVFFIHTAQHF